MRYHFAPARGWMNDPNGLCYFKGRYHAFFQHYPHAPKWGPMHWGHAVSDDLLHWEELPIALYPDRPYEQSPAGGCFSGSAVVRGDRLWLFYTSVSEALGQTQSLAWSEDGITFEKYPGNPLIAQSPVDPKSKDFRDPKVFPYGDSWRMVCGAAAADGSPMVLLFASEDLLRWDYVGPLFEGLDLGPVPECPDLFPLGDKWVFLYSRIGDGRPVEFLVGDFDGARFTPDGPFQRPERGPDFYAAQSFAGPAGERLMLGWFYSWDRTVPAGAVRAGALTLPRRLTLEDGLVRSRPIPAALPLLTGEDPCLVRGPEGDALTDGEKTLLRLPAGALADARVLVDGAGREVFWGDGLGCASFYWANS